MVPQEIQEEVLKQVNQKLLTEAGVKADMFGLDWRMGSAVYNIVKCKLPLPFSPVCVFLSFPFAGSLQIKKRPVRIKSKAPRLNKTPKTPALLDFALPHEIETCILRVLACVLRHSACVPELCGRASHFSVLPRESKLNQVRTTSLAVLSSKNSNKCGGLDIILNANLVHLLRVD